MCSNPRPGEENYDFFEDIEEYIKTAKSAESNDPLPNDTRECNSFINSPVSDFTDKETAKRICIQFRKLYYSLSEVNCISNSIRNYKECSKFLNYWVNFNIRKSIKNEEYSFCHVFNALESQITDKDGYYINLNFIYNIDKDELEKMSKLYNLYEKHSKLNAIINKLSEQDKHTLLTLSTACCPDYIEASYICNPDNKNNNPIFCKKIEDFELKYQELRGKVAEKGSDFSDYFIKLSECPNNKIITTAVTGSIIGLIPLLGVLYKFTPMGQVFRSKIGILNNDISKNDEEMTNISLMEQENEQLRFPKGTYNIKYQSV